MDQENVLLVSGQHLHSQELWDAQANTGQAEQVLGVMLSSGPISMTMDDIEEHCPGFSKLQIPYTLDKKLSNVQLKKIEIGSIHCLFLTEDGFVYGVGPNSSGQLLCYDQNHALHRENVSVPTLMLWFVERNIRIRDIACAGWFSAFVSTDGELYTVGRFGSNYSSNEPVLRSRHRWSVSIFGVGNEHLLFQYDPIHGDQVYSVGSNRHGQLGVRGIVYVPSATETHFIDTLSNSRQPFNFGRLTKVKGGSKFMVVLCQGDIYLAGDIHELVPHSALASKGFIRLDLSRLGTAIIKDFSCSWYDAVFVDSMKRVFTSSSLYATDQTLWSIDASTIAHPMVTGRAKTFHVVDTSTGRLFDLHLNEEQKTSPEYCQLLDDPHYQVASYASGYFINMVLLRSASSKTSLNFFVSNLKLLVSCSILGDVVIVFNN